MAQMPPRICPNCGSPLILRVAGQGRHAGQQFYGCTGFPNCTYLENIPAGANPNTNNQTQQNTIPINLPVPTARRDRVEKAVVVQIQPNGDNLQTRVFQNIHTLPEIVSEINKKRNYLDRNHLNAFSQWRLDFPNPNLNLRRDDSLSQILVIAEKILLRGSITICSPKIEQFIKMEYGFNQDNVSNWMDLLRKVDQHPRSQLIQNKFDSAHEQRFYSELLPEIFNGAPPYSWISGQISASSLTEGTIDPNANQRVDFVFCKPGSDKYVVEIDGQQHAAQPQADQNRDQLLANAGYTVIRIPTAEIDAGRLNAFNANNPIFQEFLQNPVIDLSQNANLEGVLVLKAVSQFQIALLEALKGRHLRYLQNETWNIGVIQPDWVSSQAIWKRAINIAIEDFLDLLSNIYKLQNNIVLKINAKSSPVEHQPDVVISFNWQAPLQQPAPTFHISDIYFPFKLAHEIPNSQPLAINDPDKTSAEYLLYYIYRKELFLHGQWEAIQRTLQGKDTILLLPTGGGKSIAFQLASFLLPGICLVIDPLIALIDDQTSNLRKYGIDRAVGITSQLNANEKKIALELFSNGHYLFCYVAPERFQMQDFRNALRSVTALSPISLIAIDEAHCVSEWGHDFRVSYLNIARNARNYCMRNNIIPPLLGLTGTASRSVLRDIKRELEITEFDSVITPPTFNRANLKFTIHQCLSNEKSNTLNGLLNALPQVFGRNGNTFYQQNGDMSSAGLVFFPHVNGRLGIDQGRQTITRATGTAVGMYAGTPPNGVNEDQWNEERSFTAEAFTNDELTVLACTKSFGMGIDKPNIRYTIHMNLPESIESFYQEAGRAGRDGSEAQCSIILSNDYPQRTAKFLDPKTDLNTILNDMQTVTHNNSDDITRVMYFHCESFKGVGDELNQINGLLNTIGDIDQQRNVIIRFTDNNRVKIEKAVHRLLILGVIKDYTIDYSHHLFQIFISAMDSQNNLESYLHYIGNYYDKKKTDQERITAVQRLDLTHKEFVLFLAEKLIKDFIYGNIELGRRRSLSEVYQACITNPTDAAFRKRILAYLELGQFSEILEKIQNNDDLKGLINELFNAIDSPNEAVELRGQSGRMLESYPNNPGLLLVRSFAENYCSDRNKEIVYENFRAFVNFSTSSGGWGMDRNEIALISVDLINHISETDEELAQALTVIIMDEFSNSPEMVQLLIKNLKENTVIYPINLMFSEFIEKIQQIL